MSKLLRFCLLSLLIIPLITSFSYAGTLNVDDITVSKEIAEAGNYFTTPYNIGDRIGTYTVGANAGNPFVEFKLSAGEFNITTLGILQLCKNTTLLNSAAPTLSADNKTLTFPLAGANLVNGEVIAIKKKGVVDCDTALDPADIKITNVPQNVFSVNLSVVVRNILNDPVDSGSALLVEASQYEYTATITQKANDLINYEACGANAAFTNLWDGACDLVDTVEFTVNRTDRDWDTLNLLTTTKDLTFKLKPTVSAGIGNLAVAPGVWTCDTANLTCTLLNDDLNFLTNTYTLDITVDGTTILSERTFKADLSINYDGLGGGTFQRTLFQDADAGVWTYRGTSFKVPFIFVNTAQGKNTYIILQSKSNTTNRVWALILASDGSVVSTTLGDITPGTPFTIAGNTLAQAVTAAGKSVGERFAAIINVASGAEDIFAYANVIEPDKARFVPLEVLVP